MRAWRRMPPGRKGHRQMETRARTWGTRGTRTRRQAPADSAAWMQAVAHVRQEVATAGRRRRKPANVRGSEQAWREGERNSAYLALRRITQNLVRVVHLAYHVLTSVHALKVEARSMAAPGGIPRSRPLGRPSGGRGASRARAADRLVGLRSVEVRGVRAKAGDRG